MNIKTYIFGFLLFFYMNYIKEDWDVLNKTGKMFIKPAWFIRSFIFILFIPIFIIPFLINKKIDLEVNKIFNE